MEKKVFRDVERFSKEKHIHVPLFNSERTKVLLLCLSPGPDEDFEMLIHLIKQ